MPRGGSSKPCDDIRWKFATPMAKKGEMTCNFYRRKITRKITRLKLHLANIPGQVTICQKEKLLKAFGNFIIHNTLPFSIMKSPWNRPLLRTATEVKPNVSPPIFHNSIDTSNVGRKDGDYYFKIMKKVVEEIGLKKVVQVVMDNEATVKAGGKKLIDKFCDLYWIACSSHCIDFILEDFSKRDHNWVVNYKKKFTDNREIICPDITRFAINFIALESLQRIISKFGQATTGPAYEAKEKKNLSLGNEGRIFWEKAQQMMKIQESLLKVLRLVDGDEKPTIGFIFEVMEKSKVRNLEKFQKLNKVLENH
ncbi:hypothetical protein P3X46_022671 [Hevea brasiliensis]|uniref:DUF659 domain-containing protein n=1 Tax=Hevea brasiliensis TaxID=3981 RepID=A0ABQ9LAD2_HEVBR|nr:hypothetical protein P3X46_022671 [Hevea brasiliensis]